MSSERNRNMLKGIMVLTSFVLCLAILLKCQMVTYAYTDEEKEAAKQWLIQHGYPPDRGGANQAYQDYLNGKFDGEDLKDGGSKDDSQAPDNQQNQGGNQSPGTSEGQQGTDGTQNQGSSDAGVSVKGDEADDTEDDSEKDGDSQDDKKSQNKNDKKKPDKNTDAIKDNETSLSDGNQQQSGNNPIDAGQIPVDDVVGDVLAGEMTAEQEADFMKFIATQVINESKKPIDEEERAKYQAELYEKSLVNSGIVSENDAETSENKQPTRSSGKQR